MQEERLINTHKVRVSYCRNAYYTRVNKGAKAASSVNPTTKSIVVHLERQKLREEKAKKLDKLYGIIKGTSEPAKIANKEASTGGVSMEKAAKLRELQRFIKGK